MIRITLKIKSRAFGVTIGTFERVFKFDLPNALFDRHETSIVLMDERGIFLKVEA